MRPLSVLRGLPLVSIEEGRELGRVGSLLIDPDALRLAGFTVSSPDPKVPVMVVPVEAVGSFGSFALTIAKTALITPLASNEHYLSLFDKGVVLLGSEVCDTSGKLVGFVKDALMDPATGALLRFRITSDKGFLSPYNAAVPVSAVNALEKDRVVIHPDHIVAYQKETHLATSGEERRKFVPLVTQDEEVAEAVKDRISSEMERVRKDLADFLFQQHAEYFMARERQPLLDAITGAVREEFDKRIADTVRHAMDDFTRALPPMVESANFDARIAGLRAMLEQGAKQALDHAESASSEAAQRAAQAADEHKRAAQTLEKSLRTELAEQARNSATALELRLAAIEQKLDSATAPLAQGLDHVRDSLAKRIERLESGGSELAADTGARFERLQSVTKDEMAMLRQELETRLQAATDRVARALDTHKREQQETADAMQAIMGDMESGLKTRLENRFEARLAALEKALAESRERDTAHKAAFTTRLDTSSARMDKTEKSIQAVEELVKTLSAGINRQMQDIRDASEHAASAQIQELRDTVETRTAAITDDLAMQLDQLMETLDARLNELEQSRDTADAFIEKTQQSAGRNLNRIQSIEKSVEALKESIPDLGALQGKFEEQLDQALLDFDFLKNALHTMQQVQEAAFEREEAERLSLAARIRDAEQAAAPLHDALSSLETRMDELQVSVAEIGARDVELIASLEDRMDTLKENLGELRGNGLHALQRLTSLEQGFEDHKQRMAAAPGQDDIQALQSRMESVESLKQSVDELSTSLAARTGEAEQQLIEMRSGMAKAIEEQTAERDRAADELRAALDEQINTVSGELEALKKQTADADTPDKPAIEAMIHDSVSAALAIFDQKFTGAAMQEDVQSLDARFRELLKDKLDALRDLMLGALDGRIEELKSADEAARIENMIGDTVQKNITALQQQMDTTMGELDARFQNMETTVAQAAEQASARDDSDMEQRFTQIENRIADAAELERRLDSLQTAAHGIGDMETRLTRKINDVKETAEILSSKIQGLLAPDDFAREQQAIYETIDGKAARLETGLTQLNERIADIASRDQNRDQAALQSVEKALEVKFSDLENKALFRAEKGTQRALAQLAAEVKSLAEDLEEAGQAQVDQAVSAVNAFQARFMGMTEDLEKFNELKDLLEQAEHVFDARAMGRQIQELRDALESRTADQGLAARIEALEKELSWAAHILEDLSATPFADAADNLARHGRAIKDVSARLADLEARASDDAERQIRELREQIHALRQSPETPQSGDMETALAELAQRQDELEDTIAQTRHMPAADPDGAFAQAREILDSVKEQAAAHYRRIVERMDKAMEDRAVELEQRLGAIEQGLESLHAIKNEIIRDSVQPDSALQQALDEVNRKIQKYETLMEDESAVVSRLADDVDAAQKMLSRTRETAATHEQIQAIASRVQELQGNMERMICEITERPVDTGMAERVHKNILDTLRNKGLREILFPVRDLFEDDDPAGEALPPEINEQEAAGLFGDRLARQILGERVLQDIFSDSGQCIIKQGDTVDEEMIRRAKQHGKFLELTLNVEPAGQ